MANDPVEPYDFSAIEAKWQAWWLANKTFKSEVDRSKPKYYVLDMFPYPSGAGLHVGHPEGYTATDIVARFKRMRGFNVLHPMGWDAFGLPAERHAMRTGEHPAIITKTNCDTFRRQIQRLGLSYDWDREIDTTDPGYYKWTQWIFTILHERGLAYEVEAPVNWCPALGTVLANEEVKDGRYVETGDPVERRMMRQWMLRITAYAERLIKDLDELDWPEGIKAMQREWIGRSEGADVNFAIDGSGEIFTVFTTRPDTLFGATYCVLAPEHPLTRRIATPEQLPAVEAYIEAAGRKSAQDRMKEDKEKTGVFTGAYAVNPVNGAKIPVWTADYVLAEYGYGAIMAVPAHDTRDYEFARAFGLPVIEVISGGDVAKEAFTGDGVLVNSPLIDGLRVPDAKKKITAWLEGKGIGRGTVNYKLRDWLFSRQRYWGEPFPLVRLADGTVKTVPITDLPVLLPELDEYKPTADGEPPLARAKDWVSTTDPATGAPARRETNTMPQWAGSCWYYLRFCDPRNDGAAWSDEAESYWMPVDLYIGGAEHAVLHLLYARFWHKVLYDAGKVTTREPFQKLFNQGMILAYSYKNFNGQYLFPQEIESISYFSRASGTTIGVGAKIDKRQLPISNADLSLTFARTERGYRDGNIRLCREPGTDPNSIRLVWRDRNSYQQLNVIPRLHYYVERKTGMVVRPTKPVVINLYDDSKDSYVMRAHGPVVFLLDDGKYYDWSFIDDVSNIDDYTKEIEDVTLNNGRAISGMFEVIEDIQIEKMSKSRYNVVNPDEVADRYGADSVRLYEMFMGPLDREKPWTDEGVQGVHRFLRRVWSLFIADEGGLHPRIAASGGDPAMVKELHKTIKAVTQNIESLMFNTAISRMMEFVNAGLKCAAINKPVMESFVLLLAPFAPHIAEELWSRLGHDNTLAYAPWPEWDESQLAEDTLEIPVQVLGKLRGKIVVAVDAAADAVIAAAKADEKVAPHLEGKTIVKEIYVPGKMVNLVVK